MKIKNESVTIKIGNKEKSFHNLILNSYIDLFADSFLKFKNKLLTYCYVKFDTTQTINENSTTMEYDTILETNFYKTKESFSENNIINDYIYDIPVMEQEEISTFVGRKITGIGFGDYDNDSGQYLLYAFLDVSKYQIIVQEGQEVVISRKDKITSDLQFYSPFSSVKYPTHLTSRGIIEKIGMEYNEIFSQLYSVGFGTLYSKIDTEEIPVSELDFKKEGTGIVTLIGAQDYAVYPNTDLFPSPEVYPGRSSEGLKKLEIPDRGEGQYPSSLLFPSTELYPKQSSPKYVIYKFKLYRRRYEGELEIVEDTGLYYYQSQSIDGTGAIKLTIKYERG